MRFNACFRALSVGAVLASLSLHGAATVAQTPPAAAQTGPGSLSGVWSLTGYKGSGRYTARERVLLTADNKMPPLLPWAKDILEKRIADTDKGDPFANTLTQCLPGGVPLMTYGASYPIQFLETPGQVTLLFEEQNHFRLIYLNAKHPEDPDPTFMGHSIGRWEDGALVVDTVGLTERTTIDQIGMPHSDQLHVVERYRRVNNNTMEVAVTIDDPKTFERPWEAAKAVYKLAPAGTHVSEYICENNRNAPDAQGRTGFQVPGK